MNKIGAIILCGGKGTRLTELTKTINKPLIQIGSAPIIFHIAYRYWRAGIFEIFLTAGWQFTSFEKEFRRWSDKLSDDPIFGRMINETDFRLLDTGEHSDTFTRIKQIPNHSDLSYFLVTYGDTITDLDCISLIGHFNNITNIYDPAIVSAVRPQKRFSSITFDKNTLLTLSFEEKQGLEKDWVGCGYIILSRKTIKKLGNYSSLEHEVLPFLASSKRLITNLHHGTWIPIDYLHDVERANEWFDTVKRLDAYPI